MNTYRNDEDAVRQLAYDLWLERGRPRGSPEVDWYRAERMMELPGDGDAHADNVMDTGERLSPVATRGAAGTGMDKRQDGVMDGSAAGMMVPAVTELAREVAEREPGTDKNRRGRART